MKARCTRAPIVFVCLCLLVPMTMAPAGARCATAENVALVTAINGAAEMEVAGKTSPLAVGQELAEGATVRVVNGTLSIVFLQGAFLELKTGDVVVLGKDPATSRITDGAGTRGIEESQTVNVAQAGVVPGADQEQLMKLAYIPGVRGDKMVMPLAPRLTIATANPAFFWFDTDSAAAGTTRSYEVVVKDERDNALFRASVEGRVFEINTRTFPELAKVLAPDAGRHYSWTIAEAGGGGTATGAGFVYVDETGLKKAREKETNLGSLVKSGKIDMQSYHTLMSLYYLDERERLFSDAFPHLAALMDAPAGGREFALRNLASALNRFGNQVSVVAGLLTRQLSQPAGK